MWATVKGEGGGEGDQEGGVRLLMADEAETLVLKDGKDKTSAFGAKGGGEGGKEGRASLSILPSFVDLMPFFSSLPPSLSPSLPRLLLLVWQREEALADVSQVLITDYHPKEQGLKEGGKVEGVEAVAAVASTMVEEVMVSA
eukprot:evm.model.NODE_29463_length_78484_cov_36.874050.16